MVTGDAGPVEHVASAGRVDEVERLGALPAFAEREGGVHGQHPAGPDLAPRYIGTRAFLTVSEQAEVRRGSTRDGDFLGGDRGSGWICRPGGVTGVARGQQARGKQREPCRDQPASMGTSEH